MGPAGPIREFPQEILRPGSPFEPVGLKWTPIFTYGENWQKNFLQKIFRKIFDFPDFRCVSSENQENFPQENFFLAPLAGARGGPYRAAPRQAPAGASTTPQVKPNLAKFSALLKICEIFDFAEKKIKKINLLKANPVCCRIFAKIST